MGAVILVKQNNNKVIKDIKSVNKKNILEVCESKDKRTGIYEGTYLMYGVEQPLRYAKYAKRKK